MAIFYGTLFIGTHFLTIPPWGDEFHFLETVRLFKTSFSLNTLQTYNEMNPPLSYGLFALVGACVGDQLWIYRLVTVTCGIIFYWFLLKLFIKISGRKDISLIALILVLLNPYIWGLSVFVFNDIPGLMFLAISINALLDKRFFIFCLASAAVMLCRQYNAFLPAALTLWAIITPSPTFAPVRVSC